MKNFMVFDIGGSAVKYAVISEDGRMLNKSKMVIPKTVDEFFADLIDITNNNNDKYKVSGIAISSPGAVDSISGVVGGSSAIPYIHGPNFKEILKEGTGLDVSIENDANCAALGECWLGAAKEVQDCAFVVCGSGVGGAIVKDKKVHKGINKHGGEFGYTIIGYNSESNDKYLTLSGVGATGALVKAVAKRKKLNEDELNGVKVFQLCDEKDEVALEEVDKFFTYMAIGIYNIQYTYDPEVIVIGGAISERDNFLDKVNEKLDDILNINVDGVIKPNVKKCIFGNDANMIGALYNFLN